MTSQPLSALDHCKQTLREVGQIDWVRQACFDEDISATMVICGLARLLDETGHDIQVLDYEICNHPMLPGSVTHHNQPDSNYHRFTLLGLDGCWIGLRDHEISRVTDDPRVLRVCSDVADCHRDIVQAMRQDYPKIATWHVRHEITPYHDYPMYHAHNRVTGEAFQQTFREVGIKIRIEHDQAMLREATDNPSSTDPVSPTRTPRI